MKNLMSAIAAAAGMLTLGYTTPAVASSGRDYRIPANGVINIPIDLCSSEVEITAEGDGDTDLDFVLISPSGRVVHRDDDSTDLTWKTVYRTVDGCSEYNLRVLNWGDVYNQMTLSVTDV